MAIEVTPGLIQVRVRFTDGEGNFSDNWTYGIVEIPGESEEELNLYNVPLGLSADFANGATEGEVESNTIYTIGFLDDVEDQEVFANGQQDSIQIQSAASANYLDTSLFTLKTGSDDAVFETRLFGIGGFAPVKKFGGISALAAGEAEQIPLSGMTDIFDVYSLTYDSDSDTFFASIRTYDDELEQDIFALVSLTDAGESVEVTIINEYRDSIPGATIVGLCMFEGAMRAVVHINDGEDLLVRIYSLGTDGQFLTDEFDELIFLELQFPAEYSFVTDTLPHGLAMFDIADTTYYSGGIYLYKNGAPFSFLYFMETDGSPINSNNIILMPYYVADVVTLSNNAMYITTPNTDSPFYKPLTVYAVDPTVDPADVSTELCVLGQDGTDENAGITWHPDDGYTYTLTTRRWEPPSVPD